MGAGRFSHLGPTGSPTAGTGTAASNAKPRSTSRTSARRDPRAGALAGLVSSPGRTRARSRCRVRSDRSRPYEWQLDLEVTYALDDAGLTATMQAVNTDTRRAPLGVGFHPYLTLGTTSIDGLHLTVPASGYLDPSEPTSSAMVPAPVMGWHFTEPRRIGTTQLDTCFGELVRDVDGRAVTALDDPDNGGSVYLWVDARLPLPHGLYGGPSRSARAAANRPWPSSR